MELATIVEPAFSLTNITESQVMKTIRSLKPSKAKDVFGMDSTMLKDLGSVLAYPITFIINQSISIGQFPNAWKSGIVTPIFKSGDLKSLSSYRLISIPPTASKIAEKWVTEQIIFHLDNSSTSLHPMQFGLRTKHSTETTTCLFVEKIQFSLDLGGAVGALFLYRRKAFDTVNHKVLLTKISKYNFCNGAMKWVESYLTNRSQSVSINNHRSKSLQLPTGVPQGSILGPLLFSIYINDLPSVCPEVETIMLTDDTVFFYTLQIKGRCCR